MKRRCVYDVESYINFFCVCFKDYDTKEIFIFEISSRKNQYLELLEFLKSVQLLIAFNNKNYDDLILNCLIKNYNLYENSDYKAICEDLKKLTNAIIETDDYNFYKSYKYNFPISTIDLFLYWSKMLRISKKLSLKSLAVNMNWHKIQDLPIEPSAIVKETEMDELISYNINDVEITEELCFRLKDDINLRYEAKKRYGLDCMNWDGVKLGLNILLKRYADRVGTTIDQLKDLRTYRSKIDISEIILPYIEFQDGDMNYRSYIKEGKLIHQFYSFKALFEHLKKTSVTDTNQINCEVFYNNSKYDIKSGGLHTYHTSSIYTCDEDEIICDDDVSSMYPTLGALWYIGPEHLGNEFPEELDGMRLERIDLKHKGLGKSSDANLLKLAMNGGLN